MPVFHATTIGTTVALVTPPSDGDPNHVMHTDGAGNLALADLAILGSGVFDIAGSAAIVQSNLDAHVADASIHFADAPIDGTLYARSDNQWLEIPPESGEANAGANLVLAGGSAIYAGMSGFNLTFKQLISTDASVSLVGSTNGIDITATAMSVGADPAGSASAVQVNLDFHASDQSIHFTDAPADNTYYARRNNTWVVDPSLSIHVADTDIHFTDAPADGSIYGRENNSWSLLPAGGEDNLGENLGSGAAVYAGMNAEALTFRTITSSDASVAVSQSAQVIDLLVTAESVGAIPAILSQTGEILSFIQGTGHAPSPPGTDSHPLISKGGVNIPVFEQLTADGIADGAITNPKLPDVPTNSIKMRNASSTGPYEDLLITDLDEDVSPSTGDFILGHSQAQGLAKYDLSHFVATATNVGGAVGIFKEIIGPLLNFRTLRSADSSVILIQESDTVNVRATAASTGSDPAGSADTVQSNLDFHVATLNPHAKMNWRNLWVNGLTYQVDDTVRDGNWTMIANQVTTERPAPQSLGDPAYILPDVPTWTPRTAVSSIYSGVEFTVREMLVFYNIRFWLPVTGANIQHTLYALDITNPDDHILINSADVSDYPAGEWNVIETEPTIYTIGQRIRLVLESHNFSGAPTSWTYTWNYQGDLGSTPPSGDYHGTSARNRLYINEVDNSFTDQSLELDLLKPGDGIRIEEAGNRWEEYSVNSIAKVGSVYEIEVVLVDESGPSIRTGPVSIIATTNASDGPSDYVELTDYLLANVNPASLAKGFSVGVYSDVPANLDDNAYGVDLEGEYFIASEHWDLVASSSSASSSAGGGTPTDGETNTGFNVGVGEPVFRDKTGVVLNFRTLISPDASVLLSTAADEIVVTATPASTGSDPAGSAAIVQSNLDTHTADTNNPHNVTAADLNALENVVEDSTPQAGGTFDFQSFTAHFALTETEYLPGSGDTSIAIPLGAGNHFTIQLSSISAPFTINLASPPGPSAGTIIFSRGGSPSSITWLMSGSPLLWMGGEPRWDTFDERNSVRIIHWRYTPLLDRLYMSVSPKFAP